MARTRINVFIVDFVGLEVVFYAAVVEETWLVAESLTRQEHTLGLFVRVFDRIIRARAHRGIRGILVKKRT